MARKKRKAPAPGPPSRSRSWLFCLVILGAAFGVGYAVLRNTRGPGVPEPDVSSMEPQVAAKVEQARRAVLETPDSHEAWGRLAIVLQAHRRDAEAVLCYRRAVELSPAEFRWHYLLAHASRDSDPESALAEAEAASRLDPGYAPAYVLRAQLLESRDEADEALEQYHKAAELDSENAMAAFGLGRLYLRKGDPQAALTHLLRARALSEDAGAVHGALAQAYRQLGDMESALRENRLASERTEIVPIRDPIHYAMRKESVSSTAQLERAIEAEREGDYETAEALFRGLVELRPDDADIRARYGDTLARQSKLGPAKEQYQAALSVNPELAGARYGLGNALNFEGDYEGAAREYRAALETRPEHVSSLLNLAGIHAFRGDLSEAATLCRKALELDPNGFAPNFQLGRVLVQREEYAEAVPFLRTAIDARGDSGPAHLQLGIAFVGSGDLTSAWEHVDRAQALGEKVPQAMVEELRRRVGRAGTTP